MLAVVGGWAGWYFACGTLLARANRDGGEQVSEPLVHIDTLAFSFCHCADGWPGLVDHVGEQNQAWWCWWVVGWVMVALVKPCGGGQQISRRARAQTAHAPVRTGGDMRSKPKISSGAGSAIPHPEVWRYPL